MYEVATTRYISKFLEIFFVCPYSTISSSFQTELNQVVVKLPDIIVMATEPSSLLGLQQLELMLLLLLGIAVQGPTRDFFVNRIQQLGNDDQVAIAHAITQVSLNEDSQSYMNNFEEM